ncbi:MAG: chromate efflux transporter [Actinomycetota bacterium]
MPDATGPPTISRARIFTRFLRFGTLAFGGPVAQIAMIRDELVERERWITRERFNRTLAVYQALPGPEAHELCVYFGTIAGGRTGGVLAGLGFMLPGFVLVLVVAALYVRYGASSVWMAAALSGLQPAVGALIVRAVIRIARHALTHPWLWFVAAGTAVAQLLDAPFWIPLLTAGVSHAFAARGAYPAAGASVVAGAIAIAFTADPSGIELDPLTVATGAAPGLAALLVTGLKAGLLTFGGAYTAIPFVRGDAVVTGRWLTDAQFLDSLALSGVLPAPLIIFGTFVGYLGAGLDGALMVTLGIFAPAFAFTLVGHGQLERLVNEPRTHALLDGVAAAVVGLIAVTAVRLLPEAIPDASAAGIFAGTLLAVVLWRARWSVLGIMVTAGIAGIVLDRL